MTEVVIVDDQATFRHYLRRLLTRAGMDVVGEAEEILQAEAMVVALQPDLAVVDLVLPGINGIEGIARLKALQPALRAILISVHRDQAHLLQAAAVAAGAEAFVPKDLLDLSVVKAWGAAPARDGAPSGT